VYILNSTPNWTDPNGEDIYLKTGNNSGNPINDRIHQNVCVDVWGSDGCGNYHKIDTACFSFGFVGRYGFYWFKTTWLGWPSTTLAGFLMTGEIYEADDTGKVVSTKKTTPEQDIAWLKWMRKERVGTQDVYSVGRHNCRTYAQWEFRDAPGNH